MTVKLRLVFSITIAFLSFSSVAQTKYWSTSSAAPLSQEQNVKLFGVQQTRTFDLNEAAFTTMLSLGTTSSKTADWVYFPDDKGNLVPFMVQAASTFSPALAKKYPNIKAYKGIGAVDKAKHIRFSVSHKGIQSMMTTAGNTATVFMEKTPSGSYALYTTQTRTEKQSFVCKTSPDIDAVTAQLSARLVDDQVLRKYRLAVAASGEYTEFHGGTKEDALAAINATVTRINEIIENELGVTLELIGTTDEVIYTDGATDPFSGGLSTAAQNTFDTVIGDANYDIGHLFNQRDGALDGNAGFVGSVCRTGRKGSAYSTFSNPQGDRFDIDLVAHEMGHQFGANHTFSHISEGTTAQIEPGSGTTIMGYAGIARSNNVAEISDPYFHYVSIVQVRDYLTTISCGEVIPIVNNTPPVLVPLSDYTIPKGTAFVLTGAATDIDTTNVLTYSWEQIDNGIVTQATFGPTSPTGALFRSLPPTTTPERYFPKLSRIVSGNLTQTFPTSGGAWETVATVERELNFSLTVRDNAVAAGQVVSDELSVVVANQAGPFVLTSQNTSVSYVAGETATIRWDVANTNVAPVDAKTVDIFFSTDGGETFPITVATNVLNDGEYTVLVPSAATTRGRFMVKATENIFFAVNSASFTVVPSTVVLDFDILSYQLCKPDNLPVNFIYTTDLGFTEESSFSVLDAPAGLNITFSDTTATVSNTPIALIFSGTGSVAPGVYTLQVVSTALTASKSVPITLTILDTNFEEVVVVAPVDGAADVSADVTLRWESSVLNTSYDIEVATDSSFSSIVELGTTNNAFYSPANLENNTQYFWRVKPENICGEGVFSAPQRFSTIVFNCAVVSALDVPLAISAVGTPTQKSSITFYEDLPVADMNVNLNIEHTFLADLQISLISPAGTTVVLVSSSCSDARNINAVFDDDALEFVCAGNPGIGGTVAPLGTLSSFDGESILGTWVLEIKDNAPSDGGRLNSFSLEVCVEGNFRPDADNDGIFDDGDDLCLGTLEGQEVNASGCAIYRFANENFNIQLESETCRTNNDGRMTITPKVGLTYTATITGMGIEETQGFTSVYAIDGLSAGKYQVCLSGTDGTIIYETFCTQVVISEPPALGVTSKIETEGKTLTVSLSGADSYIVSLNGKEQRTTASQYTVSLDSGFNEVKVFTNLPCQGQYTEQIIVAESPYVVPNPFTDTVKVYFGKTGTRLSMDIFAADGKFIQQLSFVADSDGAVLALESLPKGLYYASFSGGEQQGTIKIIKN